jgi:hypothetical protein
MQGKTTRPSRTLSFVNSEHYADLHIKRTGKHGQGHTHAPPPSDTHIHIW